MENFCAKLLISPFYDVYKNLAIESLLLEKCRENEGILYLWVNSDCIVIGSNQNPYAECDVGLLKRDKIKIARRKTGGGAVWHDEGNLNFSFIMPNRFYNEKEQLRFIVKVLCGCGINASLSGRNDIEADGFKVSGNAYYRGKERSLHHGTLLVNANIDKISDYLKPCELKLVKKGVSSVRSRVKNLSQIKKDLTVKVLINDLYADFCEKYSQAIMADFNDFFTEEELEKRRGEFACEEYIFGKFDKLEKSVSKGFDWGISKISYTLDDDKNFVGFSVSSDSLDEDLKTFCESFFIGKNLVDLSRSEYIFDNVNNFALHKERSGGIENIDGNKSDLIENIDENKNILNREKIIGDIVDVIKGVEDNHG